MILIALNIMSTQICFIINIPSRFEGYNSSYTIIAHRLYLGACLANVVIKLPEFLHLEHSKSDV